MIWHFQCSDVPMVPKWINEEKVCKRVNIYRITESPWKCHFLLFFRIEFQYSSPHSFAGYPFLVERLSSLPYDFALFSSDKKKNLVKMFCTMTAWDWLSASFSLSFHVHFYAYNAAEIMMHAWILAIFNFSMISLMVVLPQIAVSSTKLFQKWFNKKLKSHLTIFLFDSLISRLTLWHFCCVTMIASSKTIEKSLLIPLC